MKRNYKKDLTEIADKMKDLMDASDKDCASADSPVTAGFYQGAWSAFEECEGMLRRYIEGLEDEHEEK